MIGEPGKRKLLLINLLGGIAVLGSYAWGALWAPDTMASLWGGVPEPLRPVYTVNMLLSAAGYFLFAPYIALRVDVGRRDFLGRFGYSIFSVLFALIMFPSALWLPLTSLMLSDPGVLLWLAIRLVLLLVGAGSVGLFLTLLLMNPPRAKGRLLALIGLVPFCMQTAVLDALVWPAYFNQ
jgi:hypothetical protein